MFKSDIDFVAPGGGHTQNKLKSDFDFDALDGGQKLVLALSAV